MLLLTVREWQGPSRDSDPMKPKVRVTERTVGFVSHHTLSTALELLRAVEDNYNRSFRESSAVNFTVIGVVTIEHLDTAAIELARFEDLDVQARGPLILR